MTNLSKDTYDQIVTHIKNICAVYSQGESKDSS